MWKMFLFGLTIKIFLMILKMIFTPIIWIVAMIFKNTVGPILGYVRNPRNEMEVDIGRSVLFLCLNVSYVILVVIFLSPSYFIGVFGALVWITTHKKIENSYLFAKKSTRRSKVARSIPALTFLISCVFGLYYTFLPSNLYIFAHFLTFFSICLYGVYIWSFSDFCPEPTIGERLEKAIKEQKRREKFKERTGKKVRPYIDPVYDSEKVIRVEKDRDGNLKEIKQNNHEDIIIALDKKNESPIWLKGRDRRMHMHILGKTGSGKGVIGQTIIAQDLLNPNVAVFFLEPTRDMVDEIKVLAEKLGRKVFKLIPADSDTIIINPMLGYNIDEVVKTNVSPFIQHIKNSDEFYINHQKDKLSMVIRAAKLVKGNNATYEDLLNLLRSSTFSNEMREEYLTEIQEKDIRVYRALEQYHEEVNDNPRSLEKVAGLINYLNELTDNEIVRKQLCTSADETKNIYTMREIFDQKGVLLIGTQFGKLDYLGLTLGRLYTNLLRQEVFYRTDIRKEERNLLPPIAAYIDEFQDFVTEDLSHIFNKSRKANIMTTIIHQNLAQLRKISPELEEEIYSNTAQKIIFGDGHPDDAKKVAEQLGEELKDRNTISYDTLGADSHISSSKMTDYQYKVHPSDILDLPAFNFDPTILKGEVFYKITEYNQRKFGFGILRPVSEDFFKSENPDPFKSESLDNETSVPNDKNLIKNYNKKENDIVNQKDKNENKSSLKKNKGDQKGNKNLKGSTKKSRKEETSARDLEDNSEFDELFS